MTPSDQKETPLKACYIEQLESDLLGYDMPECEDSVGVSGKAVCELLDEVKRWRASHATEHFNPDWCAAKDALTELLRSRADQSPQITQTDCNCGKVGKEYCAVIDDAAENCDPEQDAIDNGQFGVGA